jgi:hypothetical protein
LKNVLKKIYRPELLRSSNFAPCLLKFGKKLLINKKRVFLAAVLTLVVGCMEYAGTTTAKGIDSIRSLDTQNSDYRELIKLTSIGVVTPYFNNGALSGGTSDRERLSQEIVQAFRDELSLEIFDLLEAPRLKLSASSEQSQKWRQKILLTARSKGIDAILFSDIDRFSSREGSQMGSASPGEVAFRMVLVRVSDGKTMWRASYSFHDKAFTDNLLALKKRAEGGGTGAGWKNTDVLAREAFHAAARKLQTQREAGFTQPE